jgi:3-methyladenine DNA glycosylase AlkD
MPGTNASSRLAAGLSRRILQGPEIRIPELRRLRREFSRELRDAPAALVTGAAVALSQMDEPRHRFVAYELVQHHPASAARLDVRTLERLGKGMSSWAEVDCFSVYLSGAAWLRGTISDAVILRWAHSKDLWWRRAALVSTVPLNSRTHGGKGDVRRTLLVCRALEAGREPMITKAVSWALRELAKRKPDAVRSFLDSRGAGLAALVLRETRNKLDTGLKNPGQRR